MRFLVAAIAMSAGLAGCSAEQDAGAPGNEANSTAAAVAVAPVAEPKSVTLGLAE